MKIVPIFSNRLYALQYEGETENELSRLMELWDDAEYLFDFYENNQTCFRSDYFTTKRNILEYSNVDFLEDIEQNRNYLEQELLSIKKNEAYDMDLFFAIYTAILHLTRCMNCTRRGAIFYDYMPLK